MGFSLSHVIVVLVIVLIIFGAGKLPKVMGDVGKGIRNLKEGMKGEDNKQVKNKKDNSDNKS